MNAARATFVPIGEFRVSTDPGEALVVCAGSCVAVALHDAGAQIGGMLHVFLPRRGSGEQLDDPPTYFADTGIPLLIADMESRGANRQELLATVAGGGALSVERGVRNDIGARNVQEVLSSLDRAGIPVGERHVGGARGRTTLLHVATGTVQIRGSVHLPPSQPVKNLPKDVTRDLLDRLARLAPNSAAAGALLDAVHEPTIDWDVVTGIVGSDLVLAMHVFRMCNSEYYGAPGNVGSIEAAIGRLGPAQLRRICVVAAANRHARESLADLGRLEPRLRHHCAAAAYVARRLSGSDACGVEGFTVAVLHGVGVIAAQMMQELDVEKSSASLGASILAAWNLPESIVAAVRCHGSGPEADTRTSHLARLSQVSCGISQLAGAVCPADLIAFDLSFETLVEFEGAVPSERVLAEIVHELRGAQLLEPAHSPEDLWIPVPAE